MTSSLNPSYASQADTAWLSFVQRRFENGDASVHDLDFELALIRKYEILAKQKRNSRTSACCLPPEILGEIFQYTRSIWPPQRVKDEVAESSSSEQVVVRRYVAGWMSITHVCSGWRKTALALPVLWQDIHILSIHPAYSYDILARSARMPLRLTSDWNWRYDDEDIHVALAKCTWLSAPIFRRLEALKLHNKTLPPALTQALTQKAPNLRSFDVCTTQGQVLPNNVLNSELPCHLRNLDIRGCSLPPDSHLFAPTLVHLGLNFVMVHAHDHHITTAHILLALSSLPALETVTLSNVPRPQRPDDPDTPLSGVKLPAVFKHLSVEVNDEGYIRPSTDLLEHLSMPSRAILDIAIYHDLEQDIVEDEEEILPLCRRLIQAATVFHTQNGVTFELEVGNDSYCLRPYGPAHAPVNFHHFVHINISVSVMYPLLPVFPSSLAVSLYLTDISILDELQRASLTGDNGWIQSFSKAQNVRCVTVLFFHSAQLWLALSEPGSKLFSQLDTIILVDHITWTSLSEEAKVAFQLQIPPLVLGLVEAIESRRETTTPIREVRLAEDMTHWDVWGAMRSVVEVTTF